MEIAKNSQYNNWRNFHLQEGKVYKNKRYKTHYKDHEMSRHGDNKVMQQFFCSYFIKCVSVFNDEAGEITAVFDFAKDEDDVLQQFSYSKRFLAESLDLHFNRKFSI